MGSAICGRGDCRLGRCRGRWLPWLSVVQVSGLTAALTSSASGMMHPGYCCSRSQNICSAVAYDARIVSTDEVVSRSLSTFVRNSVSLFRYLCGLSSVVQLALAMSVVETKMLRGLALLIISISSVEGTAKTGPSPGKPSVLLNTECATHGVEHGATCVTQ